MEASIAPTIDLSFPSELGYEKVAREAVGAFARRLGFERERVEDLKTALSEACINAIEHGNAYGPNLRVHLSCSYADGRLTVEIRDHGVQVYAGHAPAAPIEQKLRGAAARRGMGLQLITALVDEAGFREAFDGGNIFRLTLNRRSG